LNARISPRTITLAGAALQAAVAVAVAALGFAQPGGPRRSPAAEAPPAAAAQEEDFRTALTTEGRGIVRRPPPYDHGRGTLETMPAYDPDDPRNIWQIDLRGYDLGGLDLGRRLNDLRMAHFDKGTRWPRRLPAGFDPRRILETGKDPGLGVRALHKRGITGKGVGVAIIDTCLLVDHVEYGDRLRLYEEIHNGDARADMHGAAVASIAAGKTVGVAPGADLYFIAETHGHGGEGGFELDFTYLAQAVDRIRVVNAGLPEGKKIRVLSISVGWEPHRKGFAEANAAVARAQDEGIFVVSMSLQRTSGGRFILGGLGRDPLDDPDALSSVKPGHWWTRTFYTGNYAPDPKAGYLLVPMDSRTTAGPTGAEDYAFYRLGGASWTAPWIAGLYALACQVDPGVTPEAFWRTALETGDSVEFPPSQAAFSEEEAEQQAARIVAEQMVKFDAKFGTGPDREKAMTEIYNQSAGKKVERISEADFRAWGLALTREQLVKTLKPSDKPVVLERIVNPAKLIAALGRSAAGAAAVK
jgi:subtilisin family serine protease